jgi:hypothetical protein
MSLNKKFIILPSTFIVIHIYCTLTHFFPCIFFDIAFDSDEVVEKEMGRACCGLGSVNLDVLLEWVSQ